MPKGPGLPQMPQSKRKLEYPLGESAGTADYGEPVIEYEGLNILYKKAQEIAKKLKAMIEADPSITELKLGTHTFSRERLLGGERDGKKFAGVLDAISFLISNSVKIPAVEAHEQVDLMVHDADKLIQQGGDASFESIKNFMIIFFSNYVENQEPSEPLKYKGYL